MPPYQPLPTYTPTAASSGIAPVWANQWTQVMNYDALAKSADRERVAMNQRDAIRQQAVIGGYDQQMLNSRGAGQTAYDRLQANYDAIAADAAATRARNLGRVDQYGESMRQELAAKNAAAMAAANQSAIQRGLGNTTIMNSLNRGAAFDANRQRLTLEDQLLQNRIATDSSLSNAYQNVLGNRASALNSQANQNISSDNQLANARLQYIGGIQENMDGFNTVANLYSQGLQMQNANEQAALNRALDEERLRMERQRMGNTIAYSTNFGSTAIRRPEPIKRGWN